MAAIQQTPQAVAAMAAPTASHTPSPSKGRAGEGMGFARLPATLTSFPQQRGFS